MDGALAAQIQAGRRLKKAQVNDRSAPIVSGGPTPSAGARLGAGLAGAPRPPGLKSSNAAPKPPQNGSTAAGPPQLGGLFAGGMPTLKKTNTATAAPISKSAPPVPKPPTAAPPSRAPPPAPPVPVPQATPSRLPPPVPPQPANSTRVPPPPPPSVPSSSASSRPPPLVPPQPPSKPHQVLSPSAKQPPVGSNGLPGQANLRPTKSLAPLSPQNARLPPPPPTRPLAQLRSPASSLVRASSSVGQQSQASSNPPAPPLRPHTSHALQPPPLPSRPGARAAPPPPPPRSAQNSPILGGSLNRKAPPPPPRPSLPGNSKTLPEIRGIERSASTPPAPPPPPPQHPIGKHPSARAPPPVSRLQQPPAPHFPSLAARPISLAPGLLDQPSPASAAVARSSVSINRSRVQSTPTVPEDAVTSRSLIPNGSPRTRPKSMVDPGTLPPPSNRPPSPPIAFSINPPRNFPPSSTFPPPRKFQFGIAHQYPSTKKQGCDWDYKAVLA